MSAKLGKIAVICVISFGAIQQTTGFAWGWFWGIYPGAQVIDFQRLADSTRITAQCFLVAQQTLQRFTKMLESLTPTSTLNEVSTVLQSVKSKEIQFLSSVNGPMNKNQQAINPVPGVDIFASAWSAFQYPMDNNLWGAPNSSQGAAMRITEENANYDALNILRAQNDNLERLGTETSRLTGITEPGNLGQNQININQRALISQMIVDNIYAEAAADIATETRTKGGITRESIAIRQARSLRIGVYDPYNRTSQDNSVYPPTAGAGYPRF